jgi:hypothetical protein
MARLIWIEVNDLDKALRLAEMLQSNGLRANIKRTIHGQPEVHIHKPRLRRMNPFMAGVESVVRRWLKEQAPELRRVTAQTLRERFEIRSPISQAIERTRSPAPA